MLFTFIAVVVVVLIIVGIMAATNIIGSKGSQYITEAKKVQSTISSMSNMGTFYYVNNETFNGLDMNWFASSKIAEGDMITTNPGMNEADWDGWPMISTGEALDANNDGVLDSPYTGPYVKVGGTAGDNIRLIATPLDGGTRVGIYIVKRKDAGIPPEYLQALESAMIADSAYFGG